MENTKQAVLRRLFSGVEQTNAGESSNRWVRNQRADKSSAAAGLPSRGIPVTGSVRERAKAFEARYAADSSAYVPSPTPPGSVGQKPLPRAAKTSTDKAAYAIAAVPQAAIPPTSGQQQARPASVDVRAQPSDKASYKDTSDTKLKPAILTSKTAFPAQQQSPSKRGNSYDLPKTPGCPNTGTPQRQDKHVSSPPAQRSNGQNTKPTLRAGAFQAARSRSNSTPRPSEWFTSSSPSSTATNAPQTQSNSEIMQRPNSRPQSAISVTQEGHRQAPRVSALPISQSRKSRASLESAQLSPVDKADAASPAFRPTIPQRSVSAHPNVVIRPVKEEIERNPAASQSTPQTSFMHAPVSAKSDTSSMSVQMDRAKSSPGVYEVSDAKFSRPRSLTLTGANLAELDSMFQDFINSLNLSETVSRRMMSVESRVKLDMLRSGTPASTVSKATGLHGGGAQTRMPIPQFGEAAEAAKPSKKQPKMLRKMKSFMSNKDTTESPEEFMMVDPTSPRLYGFESLAANNPSGSYTQEIDAAVSQAAAAQAHLIRTKPLKSLDPVKDVRKLRVLLRNESLAWVTEWIKFGGYRGLMERLHEVVTLEWREEQHDDQVLLELLKCFRGLLISQPGRRCLASFSPSPFRPLMELLFSEKKPGELASRQCIIEVVTGLFEVFTDAAANPISRDDWRKPWSTRDNFGYLNKQSVCGANGNEGLSQGGSDAKSPQLPDLHFDKRAGKGSEGSSTWESAGFEEGYSFISGAANASRHLKQEGSDASSVGQSNACAAFGLVKSLVAGPPNEKEEAQVYFIKSTRKTRVFKLWMDEVIGVLSDYFWIFCHSSNSYWRLENIQEDRLEEPKVPGGMTGGVEYEAMEYCVAHLRLLNRLCKYCPPGDEAFEFHSDLFASGIDKVLLTLRKCSTVYYPQIHHELARYIDLCLSSGYPLHPNIRKYIEPVSSLKQSISAGKLADQASQQKSQAAKKGHQRSRTDGQILISQ